MRTLFTGITRKAGIAVAAAGIATGIMAGTATASTSAGWIGPGQTNNSHGVWCVQAAINASPVPTPILDEDGRYGSKTEAGIKAFQKYYHLTTNGKADGIVGPKTGNKVWDLDDNSTYCYTYVPTTY
ncbi:peptidoglycan-binding domain-containing protein [Streptomyces sp. NBC_01198]|uniref:peptidoglycan-binding domain-containing protein n=1 Tax=Streptomyces sp. NBC_01198 TaxID=2903769 RepID=UPI002E11E17F|nr:peptidoglycan-binding protein [Streptomyces sp. NBC_01198]